MYEDLQPTEAEQRVIDAAARGDVADFQTDDAEQDDPANGESWEEERTIRAEIVFCLATGLRSDWSVHPKGVRVRGAKIVNALDFDSATLRCPLFLFQSWFEDEIVLRDASARTIGLNGSRVPGISADRLVTAGSVFLRRGFHATGEVRLAGAEIDGDLDCAGARLAHDDKVALVADGATIKGSVFFNRDADGCDFHANGTVRLVGAKVGETLDCLGGRFEEGEDGAVLVADRLVAAGAVFLNRGFHATGEVRLAGADIGGQLDCREGRFENPQGNAIVAQDLRVASGLLLRNLERPIEGRVVLDHARVGVLADDAEAWPAPGDLSLDGFVYGAIDEGAPTDWKTRLEWLRRQPEGVFWPQPYEQLAKVLRQMGHERDAREIAYEKQEARRRQGDMRWRGKAWSLVLKWTIGHGYKPWRAFGWLLYMVSLGALLFWGADQRGAMVATDPRYYVTDRFPEIRERYPVLQPFTYALDAFVPIVDLHQERFWLPSANAEAIWWGLPVGPAIRLYLWLHIAFGWILTTVAVAGLTGLVRKD